MLSITCGSTSLFGSSILEILSHVDRGVHGAGELVCGLETEEGGKIGMDDTDGQAHAVIMLPSLPAFFVSSSFFFPFHVPSAFCYLGTGRDSGLAFNTASRQRRVRS